MSKVLEPTKFESEVRAAAAEREQAHRDRNLARKLTPAERSAKRARKLFDDPACVETKVAVFKVTTALSQQNRFKIDVDAQQNHLTGCAVLTESKIVVIVEGGRKSVDRFQKLMLRRIQWGDNQAAEQVWHGSVASPAFDKFNVVAFHSDNAARKYLGAAGVVHYWDIAMTDKPR